MALGLIATAVCGLLLLAAMFAVPFLILRKGRRRHPADTLAGYDAQAAQFGLRRQDPHVIPPWVQGLPKGDNSSLFPLYTGERGGRPVAVAYYRYDPSDAVFRGGPTRRHSVAAVRLPAPLVPRRGPCRFGTWSTIGPDLVLCCEVDFYGNQFRFPWVIGVLDELLAVADQLTAEV